MRIVVDTNVLVSGVVNPNRVPGLVIEAAGACSHLDESKACKCSRPGNSLRRFSEQRGSRLIGNLGNAQEFAAERNRKPACHYCRSRAMLVEEVGNAVNPRSGRDDRTKSEPTASSCRTQNAGPKAMKQWVTMGGNEVHWGKSRVATVIAGQASDSSRI